MKVTMQQIADAVGVSRGTVDRALHHRGRIDPAVEERIFQTAKNLGYALDKITAGDEKHPEPANVRPEEKESGSA